MRTPPREPVLPRFIHINPETNKVHLLVPIVGGQEISTDNTCEANTALISFFNGQALKQLSVYQMALKNDIELLDKDHPQRQLKSDRLAQIITYTDAVETISSWYENTVRDAMTKPSNLYSVQLRPKEQDTYSQVINPVFNINRSNNDSGVPLSPLFNAMHSIFEQVKISTLNSRTQLIDAVLDNLSPLPSFEEIQRALTEQSLTLFALALDFTKHSDGDLVTQAGIDALMEYDSKATAQDYINDLLNYCVPNLGTALPGSSFYNIPPTLSKKECAEQLSIMTQFFLAHLNIYCRSKVLSCENFGAILDNSSNLSNKLVALIAKALNAGESVEQVISQFINDHSYEFKLFRLLTADDITAIKQKFERTYRTVTATKENPHMDDFMILDREATGESARFVTHQGSICVNFAELVPSDFSNYDFFVSILADFTNHSIDIPSHNDWISGEIEVDPQALFKKLSGKVQMDAPYIAPMIRSYADLKTLTFNYALLKAVVAKIESRLSSLPFSTEMLELLPFFSSKQQRIIIKTQFEKLIQECTSPEKYQELMSNFEKKAQDKFSRKYIEHWVTSVNSCKDFLALKNKVDESLLENIFARLQAKYSVLLNNYENTCSILKVLPPSSHHKTMILELIKQHLYEWVCDGKKYNELVSLFHPDVRRVLHLLLIEQIKGHCTSFADWKKHFPRWQNSFDVRKFLLNQFFSEFKNEIKDGDDLFSLIKEFEIFSLLRFIQEFNFLINTKELFKKYLALIPAGSGCPQSFLKAINFSQFVSSLSDLQEIAGLFQSNKLRKIILSQLTPTQLKCTALEFESLIQTKRVETPCQNFNSIKVVADLKRWLNGRRYSFFYQSDTAEENLADALIEKLDDASLNLLDKIDLLRKAKKEVKPKSNNPYYLCYTLTKALKGLDDNDDSDSDELTSQFSR